MSKETLTWLNENTLIGFTEKRGKAWHYRAGADNHYPGAIPVEDVHRRLFHWEAEERPLLIPSGDGYAEIPGRKAIVRPDNEYTMGIFKAGYQPHQYGRWLVTEVSRLLDAQLYVGSAGLLRNGAVAWVSVELPENITTPEGVEFRPNLLARTSFDGSVATTYSPHVTNVVCDNTMDVAAGEHGGRVHKVRHSKNSLGNLANARDALGIVYEAADEFAAEVKALCEQEVSAKQWDKALEALTPVPKDAEPNSRAATLAERKRDELSQLWTSDERVTPWSGTAYGIWQAVNTHRHHMGREPNGNTSRAERNMIRTIDGSYAAKDKEAMRRALAVL